MMLRKPRASVGIVCTLVAFGFVGCGGVASSRPEVAGVEAAACEPAPPVEVSGTDGWLVADVDGCVGGELRLRGYTAHETGFEHTFSVQPDSVSAAVADVDRGFIYVLDERANVVLVHEIARSLDRVFALGVAIDPHAVELADGGLALLVCADSSECRISTVTLRDPASSAAEVLR